MIDGIFKAYCDDKIMLEINDGVNDVKVFGNVVKQAINNPTDKEVIKEKLNRLGNTVYEFNKLDIDIWQEINKKDHIDCQ